MEVGHKEDVVGGMGPPHVLAVVAARPNHGVGHSGAGAAEGQGAGAGGSATGAVCGCPLNEGQRRLRQPLQLCRVGAVEERDAGA